MIIKLPPTTGSVLPLIGKELLYVDVHKIVQTSENYGEMFRTFSDSMTSLFKFREVVQRNLVYPRYDICQTYFGYNLVADPAITLPPDLSKVPPDLLDFENITDKRAMELLAFAVPFERIYLFWSGGIDSTTILCSLIKNWSNTDLEKITIVMNDFCIEENQFMYYKYILGKYKTVRTDDFWNRTLTMNNNNVYVTGDCAESLMGCTEINKFDSFFPGAFAKPVHSQTDNIIKYFMQSTGNKSWAEFALEHIFESLAKNNITVTTVYDFLWWIEFNWNHALNFYYILYIFGLVDNTIDVRKFLTTNMFAYYDSVDFQYWSIQAIGTDRKIQDTILSNKISQKKYIHAVNGDTEYLKNKTRVGSISKNLVWREMKFLLGIDTDFNIYYRDPYNCYEKR
jgi:hypothetical protein